MVCRVVASHNFTCCWPQIYSTVATHSQRMLRYFISFLSHILTIGANKTKSEFFNSTPCVHKLRFIFGFFFLSLQLFTCTMNIIIHWGEVQKTQNIFWRFIRFDFPCNEKTKAKILLEDNFSRKARFCGVNKIYVAKSKRFIVSKFSLTSASFHRNKCEYRIFTFKTIPICGLTVLSQH